MMTLVRNESTTPISYSPLSQHEIGPALADQNPRHRAARRTTPMVCPDDQNTRHRIAHRATPTAGQTGPVPPDSAHTAIPPPHCHPLPNGTLIVARHAPYSKTWDAAVVVSSRQRQGRTLYDIAWDDASFGATSGAIPQTRVQPSSRPFAAGLAVGSPRDVASPTGVASRGPEPSQAPDPSLSPTHVSTAGSSLQQQDQPSPHAPGRKVEAKLGRHGAWCGATIVSFRGPNTNPTYTVKWDDASLGATSTRLPRSRVRQPPKSPSPPPRGDSSLTSPSSPSVARNPLLTSSTAHRVGQSPPSPPPPTWAHRTTSPPSVAPTRPPKQNRTLWAPLVGPSLDAPSPVTMAGQVPTGATVLLLYDDWAQAILDGVKTIEVRSKNTTKRSTIYLMSSGTDEICGSVRILSSDLIPDEDAWRSLASSHRVGLASDPTQVAPFPSTPQYAWRLGTPVRFLRTVRSVRKQGQVDFLRFQPLQTGTSPPILAGPAPDGPPRSQPDTSQSGCPPPPSPRGPLPPSPHRVRPRPGTLGRSDARATATMSALIEHQKQVATASLLDSHSAAAIADARSFVTELSAGKSAPMSKYPFQQEEVAKLVARRSHRRFCRSQTLPIPQRRSGSDTEGPRKEWDTMLTAKYTGMSDRQHSAIAHGVFVPRHGPKLHTKLNADVSAEMRWLAQVCGHRSHHLHHHTAEMWRILNQVGYDSNARIPALRRSESEVALAIANKLRHSNASQYQAAMASAHAAIAALQSTGHLVTCPLTTYTHDLKEAEARGFLVGRLSYAELLGDWTYHTRTSLNTPPPRSQTDRSVWDPDLIGVIENPADSSLFRRSAGPGVCEYHETLGIAPHSTRRSLCPLQRWDDVAERGVPPL